MLDTPFWQQPAWMVMWPRPRLRRSGECPEVLPLRSKSLLQYLQMFPCRLVVREQHCVMRQCCVRHDAEQRYHRADLFVLHPGRHCIPVDVEESNCRVRVWQCLSHHHRPAADIAPNQPPPLFLRRLRWDGEPVLPPRHLGHLEGVAVLRSRDLRTVGSVPVGDGRPHRLVREQLLHCLRRCRAAILSVAQTPIEVRAVVSVEVWVWRWARRHRAGQRHRCGLHPRDLLVLVVHHHCVLRRWRRVRLRHRCCAQELPGLRPQRVRRPPAASRRCWQLVWQHRRIKVVA